MPSLAPPHVGNTSPRGMVARCADDASSAARGGTA